jgi:outer membrane protein OmpA-like peptidoglycan-associated protein
VVLATALFVLGAVAQPRGSGDDHPLVTRYAGAALVDKDVKDFASFPLIVGIKDQSFESRTTEGRLTQIRYQNPRGRSVEEIFANYRQALAAAGLTEIWQCANTSCGPAFAASRWNRFNGTINLGSDSRYLAGSLRTAGGEAYVALAINPQQHQLTIVEIKAMQAGLVTVDPAALGRDLDAKGHVAIPGVHFETGKATLAAESDVALQAMADILKARPNLKVWIVGHTDWTGGFDLNLKLSDGRAKAVAAALAERYGISRDRLSGHGVGPLAPAATNGGDQGRAVNRRVELVARP